MEDSKEKTTNAACSSNLHPQKSDYNVNQLFSTRPVSEVHVDVFSSDDPCVLLIKICIAHDGGYRSKTYEHVLTGAVSCVV